jgi:hypothetical protein
VSFIFLVTKPNKFFTSAFLELSLSALIKSFFAWAHFFLSINFLALARRLSALSLVFVVLSFVAAGAGGSSAALTGEMNKPKENREAMVTFRNFDVFMLLITIKPIFDLGKFFDSRAKLMRVSSRDNHCC